MTLLYQTPSDSAIIIYGMCMVAMLVTAVIITAMALIDMMRD